MVVIYVRLVSNIEAVEAKTSRRIHALILPHANGACDEVERRASDIHGIGIFPIGWDKMAFPVALPYLGMHTKATDQHMSQILVLVLKGCFARLTIGDAESLHGHGYVADGLFAVPQPVAAQQRLASSIRLLHVATSRNYLLEDEVQSTLHFTGHLARHFEQLGKPGADSLATVRRRTRAAQITLLTATASCVARVAAPRDGTEQGRLRRHLQLAPDVQPTGRRHGHH